MLAVASKGANSDQDARAQLLDQFTQEFRVAPAKSLDVDWISDRSASLAVRLESPAVTRPFRPHRVPAYSDGADHRLRQADHGFRAVPITLEERRSIGALRVEV